MPNKDAIYQWNVCISYPAQQMKSGMDGDMVCIPKIKYCANLRIVFVEARMREATRPW